MFVRRGKTAAAGAAIAVAVLVISGCGQNDTEAASDHGTHQQDTAAPSVDAAATHNDADATFARDMLPHHEQAIVMSDIILAKDNIDTRVVDLANQIKAAQRPEIETMRQWLTDWQVPPTDPHAQHGGNHADMGMLTDDELDQLRNAEGVDAARQFLTGMIKHHEGAVQMAQTEVDTGKSPEAVRLAQEIIESQQREIDQMRQMLDSL